MEVDIEQYTYNEVYKNLIAIEGHLENFEDKPLFCSSCIFKHLKYLQILAEECFPAGCKLNPLLKEIKKWAVDFEKNLLDLSREEVEKRLKECRDFRKELEPNLLFRSKGDKDIHLKE